MKKENKNRIHIFLGIDVENQFTEIKDKAREIDKNIGFKNSCFTLPLHISLKASFEIDKSIFNQVIEEVVNYYLSIQPFKITILNLESYDNIIWIRMNRNKTLDKVHDELNQNLLEKYKIKLHEYDLDYKYHTTLFMDNNPDIIKEAYEQINNIGLPKYLTANQFIVGVSETGELGSYKIYKRIKL